MSDSMKREVAIYLRTINRLGPGIRQAEATLAGFRNRVNRDFRRLATTITAALVAAATSAILVGANFEQAMANVGSVARATDAEMVQLENRARELGATTAYSASQAADAMYSLASGGMNVGEIIAASEGVLKLAGATLSDMGMAAELTMSSLRQFNIEADETRRVVNIFAAGIQNSMLNMQRLSDSLSYVGTQAHSVNMSLEETTAALAMLHNGGLMASMAGTGLRQVLATLIEPGKELEKALGGVSIEVDGLGAVIARLQSQKLTPRELAKMFDIRALTAAQVLIGQGAVEFDRLTRAVTGTQAAWEMYDRQMNTTRGRWEEVKSALEETLIGTFKALQPVLTEALHKFIDFANQVRPMVVQFAHDASRAVQGLFDKVRDAMVYIRDNWDYVKDTAVTLATITGAVYGLATAVGVLNTVMAAGKWTRILSILAAIVTALTVLVNHTKAGRDAWAALERVWIRAQAGFARFYNNIAHGVLVVVEAFRSLGKLGPTLGVIFDDLTVRLSQSKAMLLRNLNPFDSSETNHDFAQIWRGFGDVVANAFSEGYGVGFAKLREELSTKNAEWTAWEAAELKKIDDRMRRAAGTAAPPYIQSGDIYPPPVVDVPVVDTTIEPMGPFVAEALEAAAAVDDVKDSIEKARQAAAAMRKAMAFDTIASAAHVAANGIADAFADAVFRTRKLLESLASVGRSIFGMLLSGVLRIGLASIGNPGGFFDTVFGFGKAEAKAFGGDVYRNRAYLVGERGPELFVPRASGSIVPNHQLAFAGAGGGAAPQINVSVHVPRGAMLIAEDSMAVKRWARTIGREISTSINRTYKE